MKEIFRSIEGYEDLYEVSNLGNVRSLGNNKSRKTKVLKPQTSGRDYLHVALCKDGKVKRFLVHRLVVEAFLGKIPESLEVNHLNEDKTDNRLINLSLMTRKANNNYGTRNQRVAEAMTNGKLSKPVLQFTLDGKFVREWESTRECGRNGFGQGAVSKCCRGKFKSHKGFTWMYADDFLNSLPII